MSSRIQHNRIFDAEIRQKLQGGGQFDDEAEVSEGSASDSLCPRGAELPVEACSALNGAKIRMRWIP